MGGQSVTGGLRRGCAQGACSWGAIYLRVSVNPWAMDSAALRALLGLGVTLWRVWAARKGKHSRGHAKGTGKHEG